MKNKNSWLAVAAICLGLASVAFAQNYWELRDTANVTQVTIDGSRQLINALLNASDINRGTVPNARLDSSSVTLQGNAFNGANQLVQLNGSTQLPAVSGTNLTNLNASQLTSGTVPNARLDSSSVTLQGNAFNGISQLIRTDASGRYPALDGSQITNITVTSISASSVTAGTFQSGAYVFPSTTTINGLAIGGAMTAAVLRLAACPSSQCLVFNSSDFDLYTSTGASAGSWRNSRTGVAP